MASATVVACDALPSFTVEGKVGEGTFGEVFLIRHTRRRERVFALKKNKARRWSAHSLTHARSAACCVQPLHAHAHAV
jgi:hypothetical protein